jgi:hypothetical protein
MGLGMASRCSGGTGHDVQVTPYTRAPSTWSLEDGPIWLSNRSVDFAGGSAAKADQIDLVTDHAPDSEGPSNPHPIQPTI